MPNFSNFQIEESLPEEAYYVVRSNKKCCSFSIDPVLQTLQILSCLGITVYLPFLIVSL